MVLCTSLPVAWLWQSENWSFPHPPAQGSHRCPASHTLLSPDWATTSVHLTPPSPCQTVPVTAASVPCHQPLQNVTATPSTMLKREKAPPISTQWCSASPRGVPTAVPPFQGWAGSEESCNLRKHRGNSEQGMAKLCVTPENTRYRSTHHTCCSHGDFCQGIQLLMEWLALNPNSPPHSQKSEVTAVSEYQWFHIILKNIHIPQSRLEFLNAQSRHQTKSFIQYIQWFSVTTLQHAHPALFYQHCRAAPFFGEGQHSPVLQLQPFFTDFPTCHPSQTAAPEACTPTFDSELWHSCLAGTGGISCPRTMVTHSTSCSLLVLPGPELLYPRKDIFPKAIWAEGERHHYNPTPAPPSRTRKEKKKTHNPMVVSTLTHRWGLKQEGRAGHSHGKSDRNTDPEFHSLAEPEPLCWEHSCQVEDTRSPCPPFHSSSARQGTPCPPFHSREPSWGNIWERAQRCGNSHHYPQPPHPTPVHIWFLNTTC